VLSLTDLEPKLAVILLIAGLIFGGGIGYFAALQITLPSPVVPSIIYFPFPYFYVHAAVKLGYIAPDTTALERGKPYHEQIIAADLNAYSQLLGYGTTFSYLIDDAQGKDSTHLEKAQGLKSAGVTVFEGGGWSSQAQSALSYCNSNGMLMWSSSSTSPTLAIANDNLFRMCAADTHLAPAMVNVMWAAGVRSIVIFQRGDPWGDGIVNLLVPLWTAKGGTVAGDKIRYAINATEFASYLTVADQQVASAVAANGGETQKVGVVMLAFNEISAILKPVSAYTNIYNVHWWGSDGTAKSQRAMDDAPDEANHIGFYSLLARPEITPLYNSLENRYESLTKQQYSSYQAYSYDISLVIVNTMYQAQSTSGAVLVPLQKPTADRTFGAAGSCGLNEFGDRLGPSYDIWRFEPSATKVSVSIIVGQYDPVAEEMKEGSGTVFFPESNWGAHVPGP
jgi:branched-chain amino acid transport system substrate-binding protein